MATATDHTPQAGKGEGSSRQDVVPTSAARQMWRDADGIWRTSVTRPPAWYPDPDGAHGRRYWNGTEWTVSDDTPVQWDSPPTASGEVTRTDTNQESDDSPGRSRWLHGRRFGFLVVTLMLLAGGCVGIFVQIDRGLRGLGDMGVSQSDLVSPPTDNSGGNSAPQVNAPTEQMAVLTAVQLGVTSELERAGYLRVTFDQDPSVTPSPAAASLSVATSVTVSTGLTTTDAAGPSPVHRDLTATVVRTQQGGVYGPYGPWALRTHTIAGVSDNGWTVIAGSLSTWDNGHGDFAGSATIMNSNAKPGPATFIFSLDLWAGLTATLHGSSHGVPSGQAVTVELTSTDQYFPGSYPYTFAAR